MEYYELICEEDFQAWCLVLLHFGEGADNEGQLICQRNCRRTSTRVRLCGRLIFSQDSRSCSAACDAIENGRNKLHM
jgi:hypothetical protein